MSALAIAARVLLVILFPFSGLDKIVHWDKAMKQAETSPLGGARSMLIAGIVIEFATPVCIVLLWHPVIASLVLAAFCVITALLFHPFWRFPGFWSGDNAEGAAHFWDFVKNFGLVGGLLLVVGGSVAPTTPAAHRGMAAAHTSARLAPGRADATTLERRSRCHPKTQKPPMRGPRTQAMPRASGTGISGPMSKA